MESLATAAINRKRLLEDEHDKAPYHLKEPPSMSKRRNVAVGSLSSSTKPPCFLLFHFRMLKSLYDEDLSKGCVVDEDETDRQERGTHRARILDDDIWQNIQDFLKERTKLLQVQKDAKDSEGVHLAAMAYLGESSSSLSTTQSSSYSVEPRGDSSPDPIFRRRTHEQATQSPTILQSPLNKALHTSFARMATSSQTTHPRNPFRLVSVLLEKRATSIAKQYRQAAAPHTQLHTFCQAQINALTEETEHLHQQVGQSTRSWRQQLVESPRSPPSSSKLMEQTEERRSALAASQAKLQLWKLLYRDLCETMKNHESK